MGFGAVGHEARAHLDVRDTGLPGHSLLLAPGGSAASEKAPGTWGWSLSSCVPQHHLVLG